MTTALFTHADAAAHLMPPGHPERVARIEAIWAALSDPAFDALDRREAPLAATDDLLRCHPQGYIDAVARRVPAQGWAALDGDTQIMATSLPAALRSVGGAVAAVDLVLSGKRATPSWRCARPATTPNARLPWAFASSARWRSRRSTRWTSMAWDRLR